MALNFTGGGTDVVTVATDASFEDQTAFSCCMWMYLDTAQSNGIYWRKHGKFLVAEFGTPTQAHFQVNRTPTEAAAHVLSFWETGKWMFVAVTFDETDGPRIWKGDLSTTVAEASYSSRVVGSGTLQADNTGDLGIGNRAASSFSMDGRIAHFQWVNSRLTLGDLRRQQYKPHNRSENDTKVLIDLGRNGTGTQPDWSGNGNSGTVTGATVAPHVPLVSIYGQGAMVFVPSTVFTDAIISSSVGTDDENVPIDIDTHDDVNTDHSDLYRNTSSPASAGSVIQNDIVLTQSSIIVDNDANSIVGPSPDTVYHYMVRDYTDAGELDPHDSNDFSIKTAPAHPTDVTLIEALVQGIRLGWIDQTADVYGHWVFYRRKFDTTWILAMPTVAAGTDEYTVGNLLPGVYEIHVRARNDVTGLLSSFDQILEAQTATELQTFQCDTFQYDAFQVREPSYVQPSDDVVLGNWADELAAKVDIYRSIDEDPAVDSDYVTTLVVATDDIYRFRLEPVGDRPCDQGFVLQYRIEKEATGTVRMTFDIIKEDLSVVATQTHADVADAVAEFKIELTSTQVAILKTANWFTSPLVQVTADNGP